MTKCECGNEKFIDDIATGETICKSCGLVVEEKIDLGKDSRAGKDGEDKGRRTGPPGRYRDGGFLGSTF